MHKVTSVEPQKKNPRRFNVFLDGQFAFGADEDTIVKFRLVVGKEIDSPTLEKIIFETQVGKLMERMYRLFGLRMRTEKEVRDYLKRKNFELRVKEKEEVSEVVIEALIENLKKKGMINDLEFAKAWVESRRKSKFKGDMALKSELFQKGIDREVIEQVLETKAGDGEENLALHALEKKMKVWKNLSPIDFKKKALSYLGRKGFSYEIAASVIKKHLV